MISTTLKTAAFVALLATGGAQAQPFNFLNGAPEPAAAPSTPPFNSLLNSPDVATDPGAIPPVKRHARRHERVPPDDYK
jgi:hypothetical protein